METLQQHSPQAYENLAAIDDGAIRERLGGAILGLSHVSLVQPSRSFELVNYDRLPIDTHTSEQSEAHDRIGNLMGRVGTYLNVANTVIATRIEQESPDEWMIESKPRFDMFETAKDAACDAAQEAYKRGDVEGAKSAVEVMVAVSMIGKPAEEGSVPQIRRLVAGGMADTVLGALEGMHGIIALNQRRNSICTVPAVCRNAAALLTIASEKTFDEQFQHVRSLNESGIEGIDRSNLLEETARQLSSADCGALASFENKVHGNPDRATEYSIQAVRLLLERGGNSTQANDVVEIVENGLSFVAAAHENSLKTSFQEAIDGLSARRAGGEQQRYRQNDPLKLVLDEALVLLARDGNREGVKILVSSSPKDALAEVPAENSSADGITWQMTRLEWPADVQNKVRELVVACSAEKRVGLETALRENGASDQSIRMAIDTVHDPDGMAKISSEFWEVYETGNNPDIRRLIFGDDAYDQSKRAEDIIGLLAAGLGYEEISRGMVPRMAQLNPDERAAYLAQVANLMQTIKTTENSDEQPVVYDLTELLGYSRPGDLMKITAALYSDSISNRLNGIGKLLSDEPKWGETLRSFNPAKTEQLEHAIEGGLVDICEGKSDQIKDLMVEYTISPVAEGGVPALEVLKELQSNGLFEYTGDKTQDTIIVKAALKSSNPVNFLQLIKKIDGEGLFGFDEDVQPQVLNFVLNNADPEKALSSVQRLNSLNGFLVDARRTYKKSDDGALQEYSLDIPFMAHPLEWLKLLDSVPDGPKGEAIRQKILDRLFLPYKMSNLEQGAFDYNEDPVQAIRVFTDILPTSNDERNAQLQPYQINLLRLLAAAGQDTAVTGAEGQITGYRGFPSNPSKLRNVLFDEASIDVYSQLYAAKIGGEETLRGFLGDHPDVGEPAVYSQADLPKLLGELRTMVDYYRKEPGVARAWINQYATEPIKAAKVVSAWQSRALALTYRDAEDPGLRVADNPKAILDFVASHGVRILAESRITTGTTTLTGDDIRGLRGWIESIGSRYAPTITLQALEKVASYKKEHGAYPRKLITAGQTNVAIKVSDAEDGADQERRVRNETFNAAVLGPDDAGGFTIGYDTGCCMTLKGASESCIWAGYEDPRYSFFTVRDSGGRLRAQSILYLAEEMGKKYLVADNIEINEGTDVTKIAEVYKTALLDILDQNNVEVDAIHIGTGFVHKDILGNLPSAETAPQTPLKGTYTDALNQRVLWSKD